MLATVTSSPSLENVHASVDVSTSSFWRRLFIFSGPAYLVSVGYMDPGNWCSDLEAGAKYRYGLLWVVALASFMAIIMQICAAKLGVVMKKDLAQACRDHYPRWTLWPNWITCEIAIGACDLAEVLGSAIAINMLFPEIPLFWAVIITAFDVLVLLTLQGLGMRVIEAVIVVLVATIGGCYFAEIFLLPRTKPDLLEMGTALLNPGFREEGMIFTAIAIVGATVMPHNLYLHSALVQSRKLGKDDESTAQAIRYNTFDTIFALSLAFLVNAAILILAAMVFHGKTSIALTGPQHTTVEINDDTEWMSVAYLTLAPLVGTASASLLFAIALLASGQSSTITGTLAGQVVMEGFLRWRIRPWIRRVITRLIAIVPAIVVVGLRGNRGVSDLLLLTQVVLAMQLPFAMVPLLHFTSSRRYMGRFVNGLTMKFFAWTSFGLIVSFAIYNLPESFVKAIHVFRGG